MKFNYKQYFIDNVEFMMGDEQFKFSRLHAILKSCYYVIRFWFRWNFNGKYWKPIIKTKKPLWIKNDTHKRNQSKVGKEE